MFKPHVTAHGDFRALPQDTPPPVNFRGVRILAWAAYVFLNLLYLLVNSVVVG